MAGLTAGRQCDTGPAVFSAPLISTTFKLPDIMESAHICVTRHGETDWNKKGVLQGWLDVPINDRGRVQARELAAAFADAGFDAIWSSPLVRARETADMIAALLRLPPPSVHEGLKERHFGAIQGIPKNELAEQNPVLLEQILRRNPAAQFVGGESMEEFADRLLVAFMDIGARHIGDRVLVITHGWVLDALLRHIGGVARNAVLWVKPKNGESVWVEATRRTLVTGKSWCDVPQAERGHAAHR
jgi:probable phosphoglycerate mutase